MFNQDWLRGLSASMTVDLLNEMSREGGLMDQEQEKLEEGMRAIIERRLQQAAGE